LYTLPVPYSFTKFEMPFKPKKVMTPGTGTHRRNSTGQGKDESKDKDKGERVKTNKIHKKVGRKPRKTRRSRDKLRKRFGLKYYYY